MSNHNSKKILVVSNEPWGDVWFSKQHYAFELSKLGNQVFFINPTSKWRLINLFSFKVNCKKVCNDLITIVTYKNNFPQTIFNSFFVKLNDFINYAKLNKYIKLNNPNLIWWQFEPFRFLHRPNDCINKKIYHVVDPYIAFWQDKFQAQTADLIICSNPAYLSQYKLLNKNVEYIPHGISTDEFLINEKMVLSLKEQYGDYAILVGNIADDVNINLLKKILENNIKIMVIGKEYENNDEWMILKKHPNLHYLGSINAKDVNNYIAASKVGLVAYNFDKEITTKSRNPLKIINYLAQNKPIISSINTPLNSLENSAIFYAFNSEDYIASIKTVFDGKLKVNENKISEYLSTIMYPKLIINILNKLN